MRFSFYLLTPTTKGHLAPSSFSIHSLALIGSGIEHLLERLFSSSCFGCQIFISIAALRRPGALMMVFSFGDWTDTKDPKDMVKPGLICPWILFSSCFGAIVG